MTALIIILVIVGVVLLALAGVAVGAFAYIGKKFTEVIRAGRRR